jgi:large subunit ribosomal protein L20
MVRVKKAVNALKNRRKTLKRAKGYRFGRSTKERLANEALVHAGFDAFAHRRDKKNDYRMLWNVRINAALRPEGMSYSKFIGALKKANVSLNRKMLAELAEKHPKTFKQVIAHATK